MPVETISTARLDLVSMPSASLTALLGGRREAASALVGATIPDRWPPESLAGFLRLRRDQMEADADAQQWLVRAVVLRDAREMIGHAGFHGPPGLNGPGREGALEIGYAIFPDHRGRGYATEAAGALIEWARAERGIRAFVASVAPGNAPSLAVVQKLGFVQTGEQWDEEHGLELVFELEP